MLSKLREKKIKNKKNESQFSKKFNRNDDIRLRPLINLSARIGSSGRKTLLPSVPLSFKTTVSNYRELARTVATMAHRVEQEIASQPRGRESGEDGTSVYRFDGTRIDRYAGRWKPNTALISIQTMRGRVGSPRLPGTIPLFLSLSLHRLRFYNSCELFEIVIKKTRAISIFVGEFSLSRRGKGKCCNRL